ncbi:hypothetical protein DYB30_007369 [Aphanomyces astaci]|uniref:Uncharacterized protein n=1 Tax=Aphanomyces astaci TaxID=112090 RepID=A0A397B0A7_APHAT|nr:hypothetical protein DYB36_002363 [Aphanomyces astaci]RHY39893.1 hypothetical protein DYB30_007369 [Aphanomyces astaci]RHY56970.1 hypothetical protein DYB38_002535 [Aphanomyces astaci]RHZ18613.1 hypothetical protein DYB31_004058 [Aphanomyces astaci]
MVELTANGRDVGSRRQLLDLNVIKCLLRLLSSNIMGICDLVCGALANLICIQHNPHVSSCLGNDNADNLKLQMRQLVEQSRGDRAFRDMLLSPQVCESGPGPTKHAARVLLNLAFHYDQVLCHVVDIWEGYISSKPSHLTIDNDLCFQQPQGSTSKWHIMYRHGSGRAYLDTTIVDLTLSKRGDTMQGTGSTTKPQASLTLHGQMHSRPGIHNCEFHIAFDNRGRPYGPLPIAHIGYWSSMHADKMWGVWEVGSSPDQFKLGTGGVFLMKKVSL